MNKLNLEKQAQIIKVLCEGNSIRSTARITDTAINTVVKLLRADTFLLPQDSDFSPIFIATPIF